MAGQYDNSRKIFENAIASIELGVEDYTLASQDPRRFLSAVRNIYAGILLLFKSKLASLSKDDDEALLKQIVLPKKTDDGSVKWVGKGKKTADFQQVKDRFDSIGIDVDWDKLEQLQKYRNNIEHYMSNDSPQAVRGYIANSFLIISSFIENHLDMNACDCFLKTCWDTFMKEEIFYEQEISSRNDKLKRLKWFDDGLCDIFKKFTCLECESDLISVKKSVDGVAHETIYECRSCSKEYTYEQIMEEVFSSSAPAVMLWDLDGALDSNIGYCPTCGEYSYWSEFDICYKCGTKGPYRCSMCGEIVSTEELDVYADTRMCSYHAHMMGRED